MLPPNFTSITYCYYQYCLLPYPVMLYLSLVNDASDNCNTSMYHKQQCCVVVVAAGKEFSVAVAQVLQLLVTKEVRSSSKRNF